MNNKETLKNMQTASIEPILVLDIEASSQDEDAYPVTISWSLPNGQIKSELIVPEDDWIDWDFTYQQSHGLTREHLFEQGTTGLDVIRALKEDLANCTVYVDGVDDDRSWLAKLYDAFNADIPFELDYISRLIENISYEEFLNYRRELLEDNGLSPFQAENNVYVMLQLAKRFRILE